MADAINAYLKIMTLKQEELEEKIASIIENHLPHIQESISEVKIDMASIKTNVDWLLKFFWIIASASIGALIVGVINLLTK